MTDSEKSHCFTVPVKREVDNYTLMHGNNVIIQVNVTGNNIDVMDSTRLPFDLRIDPLTYADVDGWLTRRINNIHRTYMTKMYLLRKLGRDQQKVIADSSAISIIDNFWVKRPDTKQSWEDILAVKDMNKELLEVALDGIINQDLMKKKFTDVTSVFTLKGAFPKVPYAGLLMKKGFNAEYEVVGYQFGNALGIRTAEAYDYGNGIVASKIFTNVNKSMCHASDLLRFSEYGTHGNRYRAMYDLFTKNRRSDIVYQLERLYILAYITNNHDMHEENFGFEYSPDSFEFLSVAPAYDFNDAFQPWPDLSMFDEWIFNNLSLFIGNHPDIIENIPKAVDVVCATPYLTTEQKEIVVSRLSYLVSL